MLRPGPVISTTCAKPIGFDIVGGLMKRVIAMTYLRTAATQADECKRNPPNGGISGQPRRHDPRRRYYLPAHEETVARGKAHGRSAKVLAPGPGVISAGH